MKNVAAYIRAFTDDQCGEDQFGLEAQRQQIEEYCRMNNMNILRWYSDECESGVKFRPGFDEIVYGEVKNPPIEAVVVANSDRVARNIYIYYFYYGCLLKKGINLISVTEDFVQSAECADVLKNFTRICAEMENENLMKKTSAGRPAKSAQGGYSGGKPPYGYKAQKGYLVLIPNEAEVVRIVFRMKRSGSTYQNICDALEKAGYMTRSGKKFPISSIQGILENENTYRGYYKYGKNDWVKGEHEAILKDDE